MASYYPPGISFGKPWKARVKRQGVEYYLGYFSTRQAAEEEERWFAERWPSGRGRYERLSR